MRLYFAADSQAEQKLQQHFSRIVDTFNKAGVLVMSNLVHKNISGFSEQDLERIDQSGEAMFEKVDGVVIEGSRNFPESGYLIAIALAYKKPILYLSEKSKPFNKNLLHLQNDPQTATLLQLKHYTPATLESVLIGFLGSLEQSGGREVPSIKFTLRITPRIERYLLWKTRDSKLSKADYLRAVIEGIINDDGDYEKFIGQRKNGDK